MILEKRGKSCFPILSREPKSGTFYYFYFSNIYNNITLIIPAFYDYENEYNPWSKMFNTVLNTKGEHNIIYLK